MEIQGNPVLIADKEVADGGAEHRQGIRAARKLLRRSPRFSEDRELKQFLPRNQWALLKQLPRVLLQELERL